VSPSTVAIVSALIAVNFAFREATFERASVRQARVAFPPILSLRAMFWFGVPMFVLAAYKLAHEVRSSSDLIYPLSAVGLALLAFLSPPGTIIVSDADLRLVRFLGLQVKKLPWSEVVSAVHSDSRREISIYGPDGEAIAHTRFHVDPQRFSLEVSKHLGVPIIRQ
jgi:hypothetical protein